MGTFGLCPELKVLKPMKLGLLAGICLLWSRLRLTEVCQECPAAEAARTELQRDPEDGMLRSLLPAADRLECWASLHVGVSMCVGDCEFWEARQGDSTS